MATFDPTSLMSADNKLKALIDKYSEKELCSCNDEEMVYINKMLIIRKGIDLDLQIGDIPEADDKVELLHSFLDGGSTFDCGCN